MCERKEKIVIPRRWDFYLGKKKIQTQPHSFIEVNYILEWNLQPVIGKDETTGSKQKNK